MYANLQQLADIGLNARALNGISASRQQSALAMASDQVSGYLRRRFVLPLSAWGLELTRATCVLAAYDLRVSSGLNPAPGSADEELRLRVEETTRWLELVAKGVVIPDVTDSSTVPSGSSNSSSITAESDPPRGW